MHAIISATAKTTASSGLTFMPLVSSSKNLSNPALWAGMGDFLSPFFFFLLLIMGLFYDFLEAS